ncbi:MAG: signal peptidase II [Solirubrobacterales bacterium]|nr:signal peptidase II [Solirubrobacterales bacterium]
MRGYRHLLWAGLLAGLVVVLDQTSKALVTERIEPGELVNVLGPLDFTVSHNDGVAFGLAGGGGILVILLAAVALVALGAFIASAPESNLTWISGGLILGGAAGNLIDRVRIGHVTDFILLPNWPAFNLADSAITVGVILLAVALIWGEKNETAGNDEERPSGEVIDGKPDGT